MLGTSAVTVKTNEHNLTDTLEWVRNIQTHKNNIKNLHTKL
jgi:hypothetical protein